MEKALLISVKPKHAVNILNGDKTLELRKWLPKDFVGWVYIYMTKEKPIISMEFTSIILDTLNGKVVARFWFDEYETFDSTKGNPRIYTKACVGDQEVIKMFDKKIGYAWHIKQLEIFYEPKELTDFYTYKTRYIDCGMDCPPYFDEIKTQITKAPQKGTYIYIKKEETINIDKE